SALLRVDHRRGRLHPLQRRRRRRGAQGRRPGAQRPKAAEPRRASSPPVPRAAYTSLLPNDTAASAHNTKPYPTTYANASHGIGWSAPNAPSSSRNAAWGGSTNVTRSRRPGGIISASARRSASHTSARSASSSAIHASPRVQTDSSTTSPPYTIT